MASATLSEQGLAWAKRDLDNDALEMQRELLRHASSLNDGAVFFVARLSAGACRDAGVDERYAEDLEDGKWERITKDGLKRLRDKEANIEGIHQQMQVSCPAIPASHFRPCITLCKSSRAARNELMALGESTVEGRTSGDTESQGEASGGGAKAGAEGRP